MENMPIDEKSNHASTDSGMDKEILNLEKKLLECLAVKDLAEREKNELLIEKKRLSQIQEEIEEEIKVAVAILPELEKEEGALTEVVEAAEKSYMQLRNDLDEIISKQESERRGIVEQFDRVHAEFQELSNEKHNQKKLVPVKKGEQLESSTQYYKKVMRCDLISLIVDVTSHICETIFTSKHSKVKLKDM